MIHKLQNLLAQINIDPSELDIPTPEDVTDVTIQTILQSVFAVFGAIAFLVIIIAGLQFVLSRGNPEKAAKARNTIIYAVIGLVIAVLAFSIVRFIAESVG